MTSREAFEAFARDVGYPYFVEPDEYRHYDLWQAAWEARGKHDAEVCRELKHGTSDSKVCGVDMCIEAIEEQA